MTRTESTTFQLKTRKTKINSIQVAGFSATVRRSRQLSAHDCLSVILVWVTSMFLLLLNGSTSAMIIGASDSISGLDSDTLTAGTTTLTGVVDDVVPPDDISSSAAWTSEYSESAQQEVRPHRHHKRQRSYVQQIRLTENACGGSALLNNSDQRRHYEFVKCMSDNVLCIPHPVIARIDGRPADTTYIPSYTVVYRCPTVNVCSDDNFRCSAAAQEIVTRHFLEMTKDENVEEQQRIVSHNFVQHTACECSRPKRCPKPFHEAIGSKRHCKCDISDPRKDECKKIENGDIPLGEDERRCVNDKLCFEEICGKKRRLNKDGRCQRGRS